MAFFEKTISSEIKYEGPVFKVRQYKVETECGKTGIRDVIEHNGAVIILALTDDGKLIMENQFRKPFESDILELPAGKIDPGEEPEAAALRELAEETGYRAGHIEHLMTYYPTCGYSSEVLYVYFCKDLTPGETDLDPGESLDVLEYDADELIRMIMNNEIKDSKTVIGVLFARQAGVI